MIDRCEDTTCEYYDDSEHKNCLKFKMIELCTRLINKTSQPTKVYVLIHHNWPGSDNILGIFTTLEKAMECSCSKLTKFEKTKNVWIDEENNSIEEMELK